VVQDPCSLRAVSGRFLLLIPLEAFKKVL